MENYFTIDTNDKVKEFGQAIIKAVEKTHTITKQCQELTKEIDEVKASDDKDAMVYVLQKYIEKYRPILEKRNMIRLYVINRQEYENIKTENWIDQLDMIKSFIYGYEAQKSFAKETIKECLKKILSDNEKFTKKDIDLFLR